MNQKAKLLRTQTPSKPTNYYNYYKQQYMSKRNTCNSREVFVWVKQEDDETPEEENWKQYLQKRTVISRIKGSKTYLYENFYEKS